MTPKEKAIELYNRFVTMPYPTNTDRAKQCALIAVDEIIEWSSQWNGLHNEISYWQEVKKEIELL